MDIPLQAFEALLHSPNVPTVCRALNMYQVAAAYTRLSGGNPLEPLAADVRQVALEILTRPPAEATEDIPAGFDHVSALNVLTQLAEPDDLDVITAVRDATANDQVRAVAELAVASVSGRSGAPRRPSGPGESGP